MISALVLTCIFAGGGYSAFAQSTLTNGLIGYWSFNDDTATDNSGNGRDGAVYGATPTNGVSGRAFLFDGANDYIEVPNTNGAFNLTGPWSVHSWVLPFSANPGIIVYKVAANGGTHENFWLSWSLDNPSSFQIRTERASDDNDFWIPSAAHSANEGYFVTGIYDGSDLRIYVNGVLENSTSIGVITPHTGPAPLRIGDNQNSSGVPAVFRGVIDEVRIYNRALATNEIRALVFPVITNQPRSTFCLAGGSAGFSVAATGVGRLSYQWFFGASPIAGATNTILTISNAQATNAGSYHVVVRNESGVSAESVEASLAVLTPGQDNDSDGLLNEIEIYLGTNPLMADSDGDGLSDYDELFVYGTDPLKTDTDGDGMPDKWEVDHGLNPLVNDANEDKDFDGVSNLQEYQYGLTHTNQLDPHNLFSQPGVSDYATFTGGQITNRFFYDRNDRLLGLECSRGVSFAYVYDGNDNLVRQAALSRASETNGLPVLWRFLNGLTNNTSPYADSDGDGWTDYQEWKAGTNPRDAASTPNLLGNPGSQVASLQLPFTPSNFVVGVGQLDGSGAEEIVLGADGNPGTNVNFLLVLTQGATGWTTQRVDVGVFGITSIAVGQVTNRPGAGIYVGLRGATNGSGRVMEFTSNGGAWQPNVVVLSTNQAAFVLGVRGLDILVSLAATNLPDGSLSTASFTTNWNVALSDASASHRSLGIVGSLDGTNRTSLRLLDTGGIQVGANVLTGITAYYPFDGNANDASGYGNNGTNNGVAWVNGVRAGAAEFNGTNAFIEASPFPDSASFSFAAWLFIPDLVSSSVVFVEGDAGGYVDLEITPSGHLRFSVKAAASSVDSPGLAPVGRWFHCAGVADAQTGLTRLWVDGTNIVEHALSGPANISHHSPLQIGHNFTPGFYFKGKVDDLRFYNRALASEQIAILATTAALTLTEPLGNQPINWRGSSLASGFLRGTNGSSILYAFTDDKNANGLIDSGDDFVTAEYLLSGTNASLLTLSRQPIAALAPAQSYGLASVNVLNASNEVFFTGEPDGQVFAWTATGGTNSLQRQLFSAHHAGKAWHALAGVRTLEPGEALVGLRVDPTNQNVCDVILWPPESQLPQLPSLPQTAPAAAVLPQTNALGSPAAVTIRLWDAEGNAATPFLQYQWSGTTNWLPATLTTLDAAPYSTATRVAALPGGSNHTVVWNAQGDLGLNVSTNILLRARAQDFSLIGDWSAGTPFQINTATTPDADNDGLPDWWEIQYFGSTAANPNDDPDGDGFKNRQEFIADTNPTDAASYLRISGVSLLSEGIKLDWLGGVMATQFLQRSGSLGDTNELWLDILTNTPPTPISGSYTDSFGIDATKFYRLKATRP